jgi:thiamine pyrophosphokinase
VRSAIIVTGGAPPPKQVAAVLPADRFVIAADSGYDHARYLGLAVDLLVGDLDSISPAGLAHARAAGVAIEQHPVAKDATDTELALDAAVERGLGRLVVVSGGGDRLDHVLATLFALAAPRFADRPAEMWWGSTSIEVRHAGSEPILGTHPDELFSVLPVHGLATGVAISGARYPLHDRSLAAGSSLGVSNVADPERPTTVRLAAGSVLVIRPHALGGTP